MQVTIITTDNAKKGTKKLPNQFQEELRPDLIKRAVEAIQANRRQPYGASPEAGKRHSTKLSRRRHNYRGSYGHGISRVPRKILSRRGTRFSWVGAFAPGTVGGRRAHPPKAEKIWDKKININERRKAIRSAITASLMKELVAERGHKIPDTYPFILENSFESVSKTNELKKILEKIGLKAELVRASRKTYRAGKARLRGRKYKKAKGPLVVVGAGCELLKSAKNVPGIDVVEVNNLNAELLAPGADIGRLTLFTEAAIDKLEQENLFTPKEKEGMSEKKSKKKELPEKRLEKKTKRKEAVIKAKLNPKPKKKKKKQEEDEDEELIEDETIEKEQAAEGQPK